MSDILSLLIVVAISSGVGSLIGYAIGHAVGGRAVGPLRTALVDLCLLAEQYSPDKFGGATRNKYRQLIGAVNGVAEYWKDC